jgi:hypothetical protein
MNGDVPFAATVNDASPKTEHMLVFDGWVPIVTGVHVEVTVTVNVKGVPVHVPDTGVTV